MQDESSQSILFFSVEFLRAANIHDFPLPLASSPDPWPTHPCPSHVLTTEFHGKPSPPARPGIRLSPQVLPIPTFTYSLVFTSHGNCLPPTFDYLKSFPVFLILKDDRAPPETSLASPAHRISFFSHSSSSPPACSLGGKVTIILSFCFVLLWAQEQNCFKARSRSYFFWYPPEVTMRHICLFSN